MAPRPFAIVTDPVSGQRGFTLIEVLVALAVIAIGLLAVLSVAAKGTHVSAAIEQRNFASWVAQNEMAHLRLASKWPETGETSDNVDFGNQKWHWKTEVADTQDKALRRVTITVSLADDPDTSITRLVGFIGQHSSKLVPLPQPSKKKESSKKGSSK